MGTSLVEPDSLLAIDIGTVSTRVALFDVVDGRYRFLASGSAPSTAGAPFKDVGEGVRLAIEALQKVTGRKFVGVDERLIMPSASDGSGVDTVAASVSAGPPLRVVVIGLLEDVSLESARRLATTTYAEVVDAFSLNDRRKLDERIGAIVRLRPDVIVVAGGAEGGASQSVMRLLEAAGLASYLLPENRRPEILFVGNQALKDEVKTAVERLAPLRFAANVRPTLEVEQLEAAQHVLAEIAGRVRSRQIAGVKELNEWAGGSVMPTAAAFGRVIRFLSRLCDPAQGVLGVDVGASAVSLAAAWNGSLSTRVFPQYGLGRSPAGLLDGGGLEGITRWLHVDIPAEAARDYLYNRMIHPASLPATPEDLAIEQAAVRQALRLVLRTSLAGFPEKAMRYQGGLMPWFEPIVALGSVLTQAPSLAHSALMLLDGLQPTGVTTLVLDQNHLAPALGAAAAVNPLLAAQALESSAFLNLGTVISPVGEARFGAPVLRLRMVFDDGGEQTVEVKQGALELIQLPQGKSVQMHMSPLHRFDIGRGPGRPGRLRVTGGALGIIVDARGRPLRLPEDAARRRELLANWRWMLGISA
ncbi:MAG: glutamate mutase L [Chloroflexi bacterium]|nr:glutamate mutase L [Chloroflexota bacterium]